MGGRYSVTTNDQFMMQIGEACCDTYDFDNIGHVCAQIYFLYDTPTSTFSPLSSTTNPKTSTLSTSTASETTELQPHTTTTISTLITNTLKSILTTTVGSGQLPTSTSSETTTRQPATITTSDSLVTTKTTQDLQTEFFDTCIYRHDLFNGAGHFSISYDIIHETMQIKILGPNTRWFALAFGSDTMDETYAITSGLDEFIVEERKLGNHNGGSILTTHSNIESEENVGEREILITRDWYDDSYDFTNYFQCNVDAMDIIWAIGYDLNFGHHQHTGHNSIECGCNAVTDAVITSTSVVPTSTEDTLSYETCFYRYQLFDGFADFSMSYNIINKKMQIKVEAPNNRWFAIGFGENGMNGIYAITISSDDFIVEERRLGHHNGGLVLTTNGEILKEEYLSEREVLVTRDWFDNVGYDFTNFFECNIDSMNIVWAVGYDLHFGHHQHKGNDSLICGGG
eukprot:991537_1